MSDPAGDDAADETRALRQAPPGYEIGARIGIGATAIVFRARKTSNGEDVALKVWRSPLDEETRRRFEAEIDILYRLAGEPHVVRLIDADPGDAERPAWTACELFDESLSDWLDRSLRPKAGLVEAFAVTDGMLAGLEAIHQAGYLHRDVKPANVLLGRGKVALGDLGMSMSVQAQTDHAGAGTVIAPELVLLPGSQPTIRSDIYSAAMTVLELFRPDVPEAVDVLVMASSSSPSDRPADVATLRRQLTEASALVRGDSGTITAPEELQPVVVPTVLESDDQMGRWPGKVLERYSPVSVERNLHDLHLRVLAEQRDRAVELGIVNPGLFRTPWSFWDVGGSAAEDAALPSPNRPPPLVGAVAMSFRQGTIESIYDVLGASGSGRVIIAGAPGSGKTAAAFTALGRALHEREAHQQKSGPPLPVPLALTLHGWQDGEPLQSWIGEQLTRLYPFLLSRDRWLPVSSRKNNIAALLEQQLIVPILDSLDSLPLERDPDGARRYLTQLNNYHGRFILTASEEAWLRLTGQGQHHVFGAAVLRLETLASADVHDYLGKIFPRLAFVTEGGPDSAPEPAQSGRTVFELPPGLAESLAKPLLLGCIRDANLTEGQLTDLAQGVRDSGPGNGDNAEEELLDHYLDACVESMSRANTRGEDARQGLCSIARFLELEGSTDLSYWTFFQSARIGRVSIRLAVAVILGLFVGLLCAVVSTVGHGFGAGIGAGLIGATITHQFVVPLTTTRASPVLSSRALGRLWALGAATGAAYAVRAVFSGVMPNPGMSVLGAVPGAVVVGLVAGALGTGWVAALSGAVGGLATGTAAGHLPGWPAGLINGVGVFLAVSLLTYWATPGVPRSARAQIRRLRPLSTIGGALLFLVLYPADHLASVIAVATWFVLDSSVSQPPRSAYSTPAELWRSETRRFAMVLVSTVVVWTIGASLVVFPHDGGVVHLFGATLSARLLLGTTLGVAVGVCAATMSAPWIIDRAALLVLASRGRIPFRFVAFLEEARTAGLLYPMGDVYRFRHAQLQVLLAQSRTASPRPETSRVEVV